MTQIKSKTTEEWIAEINWSARDKVIYLDSLLSTTGHWSLDGKSELEKLRDRYQEQVLVEEVLLGYE